MNTAFARRYKTFDDFERNELRKTDCFYDSVDTVLDEMLMKELEEEDERRDDDDGILIDAIDGQY